ncbi:hypothetical protein PIB30_069436 [Stylosanthes scabra]|uniref:Uncharacterized protein n=1 Tax=Stylosanthes scabra TaxID=79078 RepID=A0ABU6WN27_9FABA|nr:hypothetical protein [Stylosanthes scabra]
MNIMFHKPNSNCSSRDDDSKDSSYNPSQEDSSSDDENVVHNIPSPKYAKIKKKILEDGDGFIQHVSHGGVDMGFLGEVEVNVVYDTLDAGAESDGDDDWHSEEMKTPPNSDDEQDE